MKRRWMAAALVLALASLACQFSFGKEEAPPAATAAPEGEGTLVFDDDFSDDTSGWETANLESGTLRYTSDGRYEISVHQANYDLWSMVGVDLNDVRLEVDFVKSEGTEVNDIGLICRYTNGEDGYRFYYMVVGTDGFVGAYRVIGGASTTLAELAPGTANIAPQGEENHLRMDCIGNQLSLFANGSRVLTVEDDLLAGGDVGLIAGVYDEPGLTVWFDNFLLYAP